MDCGPATRSAYWSDDQDLSGFPSGLFRQQTLSTDKRLQDSTMRMTDVPSDVPPDSALCTSYDDPRQRLLDRGRRRAIEGQTPGIPTFLLLDHTVDPLGVTGPVAGRLRGVPRLHRQHAVHQRRRPAHRRAALRVHVRRRRHQHRRRRLHQPGDGRGEGRHRELVVLRTLVQPGRRRQHQGHRRLRRGARARSGWPPTTGRTTASTSRAPSRGRTCCRRYPSLENAFAIQVAYEGIYEETRPTGRLELTNGHGRETRLRPAAGRRGRSRQRLPRPDVRP